MAQAALTCLRSLLAAKPLQAAVLGVPAFSSFAETVARADPSMPLPVQALAYACVSNAILLSPAGAARTHSSFHT